MLESTEPGCQPGSQAYLESGSKPSPVDLSFLIHTVPDIPGDAAIIGLCTIPESLSGADFQGWHLAAFAAWKTLLGRAFPKNPQTWLSATDGWFCSPLVFGSKCVDEAFEKKDVTIIQDPRSLAAEFLSELSRKTIAAAGKKPIVVIVCGPTSLGQDIPCGLGAAAEQRTTITIEQIQQSCKGVRQLMLVTPSMLAATWWLVNPHVNQTTTTTAPSHIPPNTGKTPITTANLVKLYARRCTLLFVDQLMSDIFTGKNLFLHPKHDTSLLSSIIAGLSIRPEHPTKEQKSAAALLSQASRQALYNNIAPLPVEDGFFFFPKSDPWTITIRPRKGLPLAVYEQIWDGLVNILPSPLPRAFPHGFGRSDCSSNTTSQPFTGLKASRLGTDIDVDVSDLEGRNHQHWDNKKHMNAAYKLAAISLADAVVFFSKMEQPQGQSCIRWTPTEESIRLVNCTERQLFRKFVKKIQSCFIFQNANFGEDYFGLKHSGSVIPDDAAALISMHSRPVMYIWQAFKMKHIELIRNTSMVTDNSEAAKLTSRLPEVLDVIQLMWQALWQELLDNSAMQRTCRNFYRSLDKDLEMCDLPYVIDLGHFAPLDAFDEPAEKAGDKDSSTLRKEGEHDEATAGKVPRPASKVGCDLDARENVYCLERDLSNLVEGGGGTREKTPSLCLARAEHVVRGPEFPRTASPPMG